MLQTRGAREPIVILFEPFLQVLMPTHPIRIFFFARGLRPDCILSLVRHDDDAVCGLWLLTTIYVVLPLLSVPYLLTTMLPLPLLGSVASTPTLPMKKYPLHPNTEQRARRGRFDTSKRILYRILIRHIS